jgi:hypothetical protein
VEINEKRKYEIYVPKILSDKEAPIYSTAQVYLKIKKDGDTTPKLNKRNVKEILYYEELEHETYPYKPVMVNSMAP